MAAGDYDDLAERSVAEHCIMTGERKCYEVVEDKYVVCGNYLLCL